MVIGERRKPWVGATPPMLEGTAAKATFSLHGFVALNMTFLRRLELAKCAWCGKSFHPRNARQKYDSETCRVKACYSRRKAKKKSTLKKKSAKRFNVHRKRQTANLRLSKSQFDILMTQGTDEALTFVAQHLKNAISNEDTPANALAGLSKEYLDVISAIDDRAKKSQIPADSPVTSLDAPVDLEKL